MGKICHLGPHFPTFLARNNITCPDKIFCKNKAFLNYQKTPGPLTPSDHIPIIMKISANPIQLPTSKRLNMKKANWEKFRKTLEEAEVPNVEGKCIEEIDYSLRKFHTNVKDAIEKHIPKTTYKTIPYIGRNDDLRRLQIQYNHLYDYINKNGANLNEMNRIRQLKITLQTIYREKRQSKGTT